MAQKLPVDVTKRHLQCLRVAIALASVQHAEGPSGRAFQYPQGILHALVGNRTLQGGQFAQRFNGLSPVPV